MKGRRAREADLVALREWIMERRSGFPPLDIVRAETSFESDPDGNDIIFVTLYLNPPDEDGPWSSRALLDLYGAVGDWAHEADYEFVPHVHLRDARLAQAG